MRVLLSAVVAGLVAAQDLAPGAPSFDVEEHLSEAQEVFNAFATQDDGSIVEAFTLDDFKKLASGQNDFTIELVFKRDDANGDGVVSFEEFKKWFTRGNLFLQLDGAIDGGKDGLVSKEEFLVEWHGMPETVFEADDKDGDEFITYEEFSGPKGADGEQINVFAALDTDNDGNISPKEFQVEWHQVDIKVFVREDADSDNLISWDEFMGPKGDSLREALASDQEVPAAPEGATNLFAALDSNMDGQISAEEFHVDWHKPPSDDIFEKEDTDQDGMLSWAEFNGPKGAVDPVETLQRNLFIILDADQDGTISREEFNLNKMNLDESVQNELFERDDADQNGVVDWDEFSGPKGEGPPVYDIFGVLDTDGDAQLTREEFLAEANNIGTEDQFSVEDKNGDGVITWDEFDGPKGSARPDTAPAREL